MKPTFASEPICALNVDAIAASLMRPISAAATTPGTSHRTNTMATMMALLAVRPKY